MSSTRPTIAQVSEQVGGLRHDMELRFARVDAALERLAEAMEARATTCPHRETIIRAGNHIVELRKLKEDVQALELDIARSPLAGGAAGGGIASILMAVGYGIGKLIGWW